MDLRKFPSVRIVWPPIQRRRSPLKTLLIGAGVLAGAAIVAFGVQRVRSALADSTMHHRHQKAHNGDGKYGDDGLPVDLSG